MLARSRDGGGTFERVTVDSEVQRVSSPDEATPAYTEMIPAIATDPAKAGRVAVAWPQASGPESSRILLRYSIDGGNHWSQRVDVANDPAAGADQHDHVTLSWLPGGRLFVGWRDRRCCGGSFSSNYQEWVRAVSFGSGSTITPGATVEYTEGPQPPTTGGRGELQPDEFQGLAAARKGVALTWSQLTGSVDDLMYRRVPLSAFASP